MGNYRRGVLVKSFGFVLLVVALGIASWMSSKDGATESTPANEPASPPEVIHPRKDLDIYLGIWMPALYHMDIHSLQDPQDLNRIGANTAAFAMEMAYNEEGFFHERRVDVARSRAKHYAKKYKDAGLAVMVAPEPVEAKSQGKPGRIPLEIREEVLKNYETEIIEFAEMAEKEQIEIFSPMNEPDFKLGRKLASSWGQEILPKIRKVYSGKILWKGFLIPSFEKYKRIDFTGYDIVGMTIYPIEDPGEYSEKIASNIAVLKRQAEEDGIAEVFVSEFGVPYSNPTENEANALEIVFKRGQNKVSGFFVFDPPEGFGTLLKGSNLEDIISHWFRKLGNSDT